MQIELVKEIGTCKLCEEKKSSWHFIISKGNKGFICEDCIDSFPYVAKQFRDVKREHINQCKSLYLKNIEYCNRTIESADSDFLYKVCDVVRNSDLTNAVRNLLVTMAEREINIKELEKLNEQNKNSWKRRI